MSLDSPAPATNAITLRRVRFSYPGGQVPVLSDLDLTIPAGRITALLGPNGCGKTTLLNLLLGVLQPDAGTILLGQHARGSMDRQEQSRFLSLVPQEEALSFPLTVEEFVLLGRAPWLRLLDRPGPQDRAIARQAMQEAGILALRQRSMLATSGGERQLASVARALAQQAHMVLMDEPTSHLDLGNKQRVLELIQHLRASGRGVLFTTHDPNAAFDVAENVVLLRQGGGVVDWGEPAAVLTSEALSATYGVRVQILEAGGRRMAVTGTTPGT